MEILNKFLCWLFLIFDIFRILGSKILKDKKNSSFFADFETFSE